MNQRVKNITALPDLAIMMAETPPHPRVSLYRKAIAEIMNNKHTNKLLVICGPCSIHDVHAALEYAKRLAAIKDNYPNLYFIMRVYFEKPRTTTGWKGLINDPHMDSSYDISSGLRIARKLLYDINELGLPCGCEFLDTISSNYVADMVSWGAIGARTTESQVHRELASGLSCPVFFKNGTSGNTQIAVDAMACASKPHTFLGIDSNSAASIITTTGNECLGLILRGGSAGPNYFERDILNVEAQCLKSRVVPNIIVDCSHGNSQKIYQRQPEIALYVKKLVDKYYSIRGSSPVLGIMLESFIVEGSQSLPAKVYGQSITDACISWETTVDTLDILSRHST